MVEGLGKKFKIPHEKRNSILESVANALQIFERERFSYEEFWALRDISFSVQRGESLGVIGDNGSGKSTLLKILARIIRPTSGTMSIGESVAPILELGIGFHPELSARDNIRMYGSIMGLKREDVRRKIDPILEFAGLTRFADAKLKNLSSGMQMRLAFSVAIEIRPEIFLIDEALAVGDMEFQEKCLKKFKELQNEGTTMVLVSHSMELIKSFCTKALYLSKGEAVALGSPQEVTATYLNDIRHHES